ncbi:MAG: guanitoxin biosynthesis MBL fold metallo-hydrolase GntH [Planctomycetota bacterium]
MTRIKQAGPTVLFVASIAGLVGYFLGGSGESPHTVSNVEAQEASARNEVVTAQETSAASVSSTVATETKPKITPTGKMSDPSVYFPGTEELASDEMRVVACGTGMPTARASQAASCWLVELGNGDKFLFDAGTGSAERVASMRIPYDYLNKIFISHLHTDHFGDFAAYFIGGWVAGRQGPLHIYGPSGDRHELGTQYAIEHWEKALSWDIEGRAGRLPASGGKVIVHEFDYKGENAIVYEQNGVTIRSWPANHVINGSVSYSLEWNGLKFVFGGDTYPNQWYDEYARDADIAIHECFIDVPNMIEKFGFSVSNALEVGTQIHTAPEAFGKVMSGIQPRLAVAYHFFNDPDTAPPILAGIRATYDGPLSLAEDYMVWNVTKDDIRVRMAAINEDMWPPPAPQAPPPVDRSITKYTSDWIVEKNLDVSQEVQRIYDRTNKQYGTNEQPNQ